MSKRKTKKSSAKYNKKAIAIVIVGIVLVSLVVAQICFNRFVLKELHRHSAFQMRSLIVEAMQGLDDLRQSPENDRRIPEVRAVLPEPSPEVQNLRYLYHEPVDGSAAHIEITTKELIQTAKSIHGETVEEVFDRVPEAQACNRGFSLYFGDTNVGEYSGDTLSFVSEKQLNDGRVVQVWREKGCGDQSNSDTTGYQNHEFMNNLEKHLLQIQSY